MNYLYYNLYRYCIMMISQLCQTLHRFNLMILKKQTRFRMILIEFKSFFRTEVF